MKTQGRRPAHVGSELLAQICFHGEPVAKARPRLVINDGRARAYTEDKTTVAEDAIRLQLRAAGVRKPALGFLEVRLWFYVTREKVDVDNLAKLVLDACNRILWGDDKQVVRLVAEKIRIDRSGDPRTELELWQVGVLEPPVKARAAPKKQR